MSKTVIVAPLNWGLGHATRSITVINSLIATGCKVIIASDGNSLNVLKKQFPFLDSEVLPSYSPVYPATGNMALAMLKQAPKMLVNIRNEQSVIKKIALKYKAEIIFSDNRYGCFTDFTKNIFLSHQLMIQAPESLQFLQPSINRLHAKYINRFHECWIPDVQQGFKLSGVLSVNKYIKIPQFNCGLLSTFQFSNISDDSKFDLVAILSGPEPQRTIFEGMIIEQLEKIRCRSLVIRGKISDPNEIPDRGIVQFKNYVTAEEIVQHLSTDTLVIARSGYSTIMDLAQLGVRALLVPTPGQTEQEYLASYLDDNKIFMMQTQNNLDIQKAIEMKLDFAALKTENNILLQQNLNRILLT